MYPKDLNKRAADMWDIIRQRLSVSDLVTVDLGCGTGDFLWKMHAHGAREVHGVDHKWTPAFEFMDTLKRRQRYDLFGNVYLWQDDLNRWSGEWADREYDLALCFSVLPYLDDPKQTLFNMRSITERALVECQLSGDGPGLPYLHSWVDVRDMILDSGWSSAEPLGCTVVEYRQKLRWIMLCT